MVFIFVKSGQMACHNLFSLWAATVIQGKSANKIYQHNMVRAIDFLEFLSCRSPVPVHLNIGETNIGKILG